MLRFLSTGFLALLISLQANAQVALDEDLVDSILDFDTTVFGPDSPEFEELIDRFEQSVGESFAGAVNDNDGGNQAVEDAASATLSILLDPDSPLADSPLLSDLSTSLNTTVISQTQQLGRDPNAAVTGLVDGILSQDSVENRSATATKLQTLIGSTFDAINQSDEAIAGLLDTVSTLAFDWADTAVQDQLADTDQPDDGSDTPNFFFDFNGFIGGALVQEATRSAFDLALTDITVDDTTGQPDPASLDLAGVADQLLATVNSLPEGINSFVSPGESIGALVADLSRSGFAPDTALSSVLDLSNTLNATLGAGEDETFLSDAFGAASESFFRSLFPTTETLIDQASAALPADVLAAADGLANADIGSAIDQIGNLASLQSGILNDPAAFDGILPDFDAAEIASFQETFAAIVGETLQDDAPEDLGATFDTLFEQVSDDVRASAVQSAFSTVYTDAVSTVIAAAAAAGDADAVQELTSSAVGTFSQNLTFAGEASSGYLDSIDGIVSAVAEVVDLSTNPEITAAVTSGVVGAAATTDTRDLLVDDADQIDNIAVVQAADAILTSRLQAAVETVTSAIVATNAENASDLISVVAETTIVTAASSGRDQNDLISLASAVVEGGQNGIAEVLDPGEIGGDIEDLQESVVETFLDTVENNDQVASIVTEPVNAEDLDERISEGPTQSVPTVIADNEESDTDGRIVAPEDFLSAS